MVELIWSWSAGRLRSSHLWAGQGRDGKRISLCGVQVPQSGDDMAASTLDCEKCRQIAVKRGIRLPEIFQDKSIARKGCE